MPRLSNDQARDRINKAQNAYLVGPILRACELLKCFQNEEESLALCDIVSRTGLNKTTAFRAAQTLVAGGLMERVGKDRYRSSIVRRKTRTMRLGYAAMTTRSLFARDVTESIRYAATQARAELIETDNELSPRMAIRNAEQLIREGVDLAIEFQVCQSAAPAVAAKFADAKIPLIAVHTPHPGSTFFGGNNYLAGRMGGKALGAYASANWNGDVQAVLLLGHAAAGELTNSRLTGMAVSISECLPALDPAAICQIDCGGGYTEAVDFVTKYLNRTKAKRILVGAINDSVALGALRAFTEAGRQETCAIMGQNGTLAARLEMRKRNSRLIGSVAFYPERYGEHLLPLASSILQGQSLPQAIFMKHTLISPPNVNDLYPNDNLTTAPDADLMLFGRYH